MLSLSLSLGALSVSAQDVDEYIWAPEYERLVDYLAAQTANVSQVTALELRFGSTGRVRCLPGLLCRLGGRT